MKTSPFFLAFLLNIACTLPGPAPGTAYLCNSKSAKKYHMKENCRGLSNCTYKTIKTTVDDAKKQGKTLCGWEK